MTPAERQEFIADIAAAIRFRAADTRDNLNEDEVRAIRLLIKKQEQSIQLRQAIIEKSLTGLVWMAIVGFGYVFIEWAKAHGYKP